MPQSPGPDVSIVIPVYNKLDLTRACVASIHAQAAAATFEILVVDNGSSDGTAAWLAAEDAAGRLRAVDAGGNLGFAKGCNLGARHARGRYLLFLNNDMEVLPGWLEPLVGTLDADPDVGVVGARLLFPDGTIQHAGVAMVDYVDEDPPLLGGQHKSYRKPHDDPEVLRPQLMQVVTGACLLIRPEAFTAAGGFDEGYWNGNEDVDLCLKAGEAGWLVAYRPESTIIHYESQSGPERWTQVPANLARFNAAWRGRARPDFIEHAKVFTETPHSVLRLYAPPRQLYRERRRAWPDAPTATVVVGARGDVAARLAALAALLEHTDPRHPLRLMDDGRDPEATARLTAATADHPDAAVVSGRGPAGVNAVLAAARGDAVALVAGDAVVGPGWLDRLLSVLARRPQVGLVGPVTDTPTPGQTVGADHDPDDPASALADDSASQLAGFCVLLRRTVVERIGAFDERYAGLDGAVIDLCLRATLGGFRSAVARDVFVHAPTAPAADTVRGRDLVQLCAKWPLGDGRDDALQAMLARGFLPPLHFEALPATPHAASVAPGTWELDGWIEAGEEAFGAGRFAEAVRLFRAASAARPEDARAANDLAVAVLRLDPEGRGVEMARAILQSVLARDPGNEDAAWNLAQLDAPAAV